MGQARSMVLGRLGGSKLGRFEKILVGVSLVIFLQSLVVYLTDYPIIRSLFVSNEGAQSAVIGLLVKKSGSIVRQTSNESEFRPIEASSPVYNMDLVVTSADSEAYVQFQAGGFVRIGSDSMVRLSFVPELAVGGVVRLANLEVVTGKVYGYAGNQKLVVKSQGEVTTIRASSSQGLEVDLPASTPNEQVKRVVRVIQPLAMPVSNFKPLSETEFKVAATKKLPVKIDKLPDPVVFETVKTAPVVEPSPVVRTETVATEEVRAVKEGQKNITARVLAVPKIDSAGLLVTADNIVKKIVMTWAVQPKSQALEVTILKTGTSTPVLKRVVSAQAGRGSLQWQGVSPGKYSWEIRDDHSQLLQFAANTRGDFVLAPDFKVNGQVVAQVLGAKALKIDEKKTRTSRANEFKIDVNWSKVPGVREYELRIGKEADHPILANKMMVNHYEFSRGKILLGGFTYQVIGFLENGFIAHLPPTVFGFQFVPPALSVPENNAILSQREIIEKDQDNLMLIWESTPFTQRYQVEVSRDVQFVRTFLKRDSKENYLMMLKPVQGHYWWRVRSFGEGVESMPSPPYHYVIGQ